MAMRGAFSRSFVASARAAASRSSPAPRAHTPRLAGVRPQRHSLAFSYPRMFRELGCAQSLLPLHSVVAASRLTSHLSVAVRACCELSEGTFCRPCPDGN